MRLVVLVFWRGFRRLTGWYEWSSVHFYSIHQNEPANARAIYTRKWIKKCMPSKSCIGVRKIYCWFGVQFIRNIETCIIMLNSYLYHTFELRGLPLCQTPSSRPVGFSPCIHTRSCDNWGGRVIFNGVDVFLGAFLCVGVGCLLFRGMVPRDYRWLEFPLSYFSV